MGDCSRDVKDFVFKQCARLRLWESGHKEQLENELKSNECLRLITTSSKYGLCIVASLKGFIAVKTEVIHNLCSKSQHEINTADIPSKRVPYPIGVNGLPKFLCINSTENIVAVAVSKDTPSVYLYDIRAFLDQPSPQPPLPFAEVKPSNNQGSLLIDMQWNPSIENNNANILTTVTSCGTVTMFEIGEGNKYTVTARKELKGASCVCWSPKGKQIVVGMRDASLNQLKPDLSIAKNIPSPRLEQVGLDPSSGALLSRDIVWLSTTRFLLTASDSKGRLYYILICCDKAQPIRYQNLDDVTFPSVDGFFRSYMIYVQQWSLVFCTTPAGTETAVIGPAESDQSNPSSVWNLIETGRCELPLDSNRKETRCLGSCVDYTGKNNILIDETRSCPPAPLVVLLSSDGVLCPFYACYTDKNKATSLNKPSQALDMTYMRQPMMGIQLQSNEIPKKEAVKEIREIKPLTAMVAPQKHEAAVTAPPVVQNAPPPQPPSVTPQKAVVSASVSRKVPVTPEQKALRAYVQSEIEKFETQLNQLKTFVGEELPSIGSDEEIVNLPRDTFETGILMDGNLDEMQQVEETRKQLEQDLTDAWASINRLTTLSDRFNTAEYHYLMRKQPIDPVVEKSVADIKHRFRKNERLLTELQIQAEECKKKIQKKSIVNQGRRSLHLVYATIGNVRKIIDQQTRRVHALGLKPSYSHSSTPDKRSTASKSVDQHSHLSQNVSKLDSSLFNKLTISSKEDTEMMQLNSRLKEVLKSRTQTPIRTTIPELEAPNFKWPTFAPSPNGNVDGASPNLKPKPFERKEQAKIESQVTVSPPTVAVTVALPLPLAAPPAFGVTQPVATHQKVSPLGRHKLGQAPSNLVSSAASGPNMFSLKPTAATTAAVTAAAAKPSLFSAPQQPSLFSSNAAKTATTSIFGAPVPTTGTKPGILGAPALSTTASAQKPFTFAASADISTPLKDDQNFMLPLSKTGSLEFGAPLSTSTPAATKGPGFFPQADQKKDAPKPQAPVLHKKKQTAVSPLVDVPKPEPVAQVVDNKKEEKVDSSKNDEIKAKNETTPQKKEFQPINTAAAAVASTIIDQSGFTTASAAPPVTKPVFRTSAQPVAGSGKPDASTSEQAPALIKPTPTPVESAVSGTISEEKKEEEAKTGEKKQAETGRVEPTPPAPVTKEAVKEPVKPMVPSASTEHMDEMADEPTASTAPAAPSNFSFAPPKSTAASPFGGGFGTGTATAATFGAQPATQPATIGGGFGAAAGSPPSAFGATAAASPAAQSIFGGGNTASPNAAPFGTTPTPAAPAGVFGGGFGGLGLGGQPNAENANKNVFGGGFGSKTPSTLGQSLFGGSPGFGQTASTFGSPAATTASAFGGGAVSFGGAPGFGSASPQQQQQSGFGQGSPFGSPSAFGASTAFGAGASPPSAFGAAAAFGSGSAFGGSTFGGGNQQGSSIFGGGQTASPPGAGGFAQFAQGGNALSFGSLATQPAAGSTFGGGSTFGSSSPPQSSAFSQWR